MPDISGWLDSAVVAGAAYAVYNAKHHDGFALWPTAYAVPTFDPYSIAETTWYAANGSPDLLEQFVDGCNSRGLMPVIYYSIIDLTYEARSETDEQSDPDAYIAMIKTQLTELLSNYGFIGGLWLDLWGTQISFDDIPYSTLADHIKALSPSTLIINNNHEHPTENTDIEEYEITNIPAGNTRPSERIQRIRKTGSWYWVATEDQTQDAFRTAGNITSLFTPVVPNNGTLLLAVMPDQAGALPVEQVNVLEGGIVVP